MGLSEVDPLAVLPVTAASASAAFARASDPAGDEVERRNHLGILRGALTATRSLLDSCDREVARLEAELSRRAAAEPCRGASPVCCRCVGVPLVRAGGVGHCRRCGWSVEVPAAGPACQAIGTVVLRDLTGAERALCLSHAAVAVQQVDQLAVVAASRHCRASLSELAGANCVVGRRVRRLAEAEAEVRGRDA